MTDEIEVQEIVARLSRPTAGGGHVIERAAMRAEGDRFHQVEAWVIDHGGQGEGPPATVGRGLFSDRESTQAPPPVRYRLPAGALD